MELDINAALTYLQALHPNTHVSKDTIYHKIHRGRLRASKRKGRYTFTEEALRAVTFRQARPGDEANRVRVNWGAAFGLPASYWASFRPQEIHTNQDMARLTDIFGELVDAEGLRSALYERFKVWYEPGTIKQRRYRGSLLAVGYSGANGRKQWWYPLKQLDYLHFRPALVHRDS